MGAETRLAVVLFGSFVLWIPALGSVLRGELDAGVAGVRWGIGAALVWAMVAALSQLISGYRVAPAEDAPARRSTDRADDAVDGGSTGADNTDDDNEAVVDGVDDLVVEAAEFETV